METLALGFESRVAPVCAPVVLEAATSTQTPAPLTHAARKSTATATLDTKVSAQSCRVVSSFKLCMWCSLSLSPFLLLPLPPFSPPQPVFTPARLIIVHSFHLIYPLTMRVIGAPQVILQPVSSIFPCFSLPSGTWRTPGLSIP